ncbi:MAG: hypothetical protein K8963_11505, partial [Proteobacteria bacterium]|nr:hypothetical protein [Pseudomonadota bacterium]
MKQLNNPSPAVHQHGANAGQVVASSCRRHGGVAMQAVVLSYCVALACALTLPACTGKTNAGGGVGGSS